MTVPGIAARAKHAGVPTLAQAAALILSLFAMTQPLWSITRTTTPSDHDTSDYTWGTRTTYRFERGSLDRIIIDLFSGPSFTEFRMREVITNGFLLIAAAAAALFLALAVPWVSRTPLPLLTVVLGLASTVIGLAAALYPVLTVTDAFRADNPSATFVGAFAGQASPSSGLGYSWGPGAAWYLLVTSVALTALATVVLTLRFSLPRAPHS